MDDEAYQMNQNSGANLRRKARPILTPRQSEKTLFDENIQPGVKRRVRERFSGLGTSSLLNINSIDGLFFPLNIYFWSQKVAFLLFLFLQLIVKNIN